MNPVNPYKQLCASLSRRDFLRRAGGCAALGSASLLSTLLNLRLTQEVLAASSASLEGYKALICVFLFGGCDSFQILTPYDGDASSGEFGKYVTKRGGIYNVVTGGLALPKSDPDSALNVIPITAGSGPNTGRSFGVHRKMPEIATLYGQGKAAFVANVGSLLQRMTMADYSAGKYLPKGLYSHSDEQRNWSTGIPSSNRAAKGWGGRIADLLSSSTNGNETISMSIALNSNNIFQRGNTVFPYIVNENTGADTLDGYPTATSLFDRLRVASVDAAVPKNSGTLDGMYSDLLQRSHAREFRDAIEAAIAFNAATSTAPPGTFPSTSIGRQAQWVARTINARTTLNQTRQLFFISRGGFDDHDNLITNQDTTLLQVSQAINALYQSCVSMGVENDVAIFTVSDFARTLSSNGKGSDHAWGANAFVVGGSVKADVWGKYPTDLTAAADPVLGNLDAGRGRLIPTTSVDEYAAELALWFGVGNNSELETVLPNIRTFYTSGAPVGFLL
jgi:uncharacterized protein (DUF1501 family)